MKKLLIITFALVCSMSVNAQTETELIEATLTDYMDGTANGEPDRLKRAFHEDLNLYSIDENGELSVRNGQEYIALFKEGQKRNRIGRILSIDYENNAATAKVEIKMPNRVFIDYFLLLKINGEWKIVHKSYTLATE